MEKRFDAIVDLNGNAVVGATVRVQSYPGGALSTIYSDNLGVTAIPNPLTTDADGYFEYYAADGHYSWVITTNISTKTINDIEHGPSGGGEQFVVATGTGNAMVVAAFSTGYQMADGDEIRVRAPGENTVTNPTISLPGVGVLTITKRAGQALEAKQGGVPGTGDINGAGNEITLRYVASVPRMELIGVL